MLVMVSTALIWFARHSVEGRRTPASSAVSVQLSSQLLAVTCLCQGADPGIQLRGGVMASALHEPITGV